MKINFKTGLILGSLLATGLLIYGYYYIKEIMEKTENVSSIDLTQFEYQNLDGEDVLLSDFSDKNILVNFWATWCKPCIEEFPLLDETQNQVIDDFVFLMVSYESIDKINTFTKKNSYQFIFLKSNNFLVEGISTLPQSFILNRDLDIVHHHPSNFKGTSKSVSDSLRIWIEP